MVSMLRNDAVGDYRAGYQAVGQQRREVLLIRGTEDVEITQEMIAEIQSFIRRLTFRPVDGAGHGIVFQKPETLNPLIIDFLLN
jgi:pimeloyl-ACP methyl ester carboxylesterase